MDEKLENEIKNRAKTQSFTFKSYYRYVFIYENKVISNDKVYLIEYNGWICPDFIDFLNLSNTMDYESLNSEFGTIDGNITIASINNLE